MQIGGVGAYRYDELKAIYAAQVDRETKSMAIVNLNEGKAESADEAIAMAKSTQGGKSFREYFEAAKMR